MSGYVESASRATTREHERLHPSFPPRIAWKHYAPRCPVCHAPLTDRFVATGRALSCECGWSCVEVSGG